MMRMTGRYKDILLTVVVVIVIIAAAKVLSFLIALPASTPCMAKNGEKPSYAKGFTPDKFRQIRLGMTKEVEK